MPSVRSGRFEVAYDLAGDGIPLVLLHGTTANRHAFAMVQSGLAGVQAIPVDLPGSGETIDHDPSRAYDTAELARIPIDVADAVGVDRIHLAGWSLGAVIAAATAASYPDRVASLALVCGWAKTDARMKFRFSLWRHLIATDPIGYLRFALAYGFGTAFHDSIGDALESLVTPEAASFTAPGSDKQLAYDQTVDVTELLAAVSAPTLVVGCTDDEMVEFRHSEFLAGAIAGASLVAVDGGHVIVQENAPQLAELLGGHVRR